MTENKTNLPNLYEPFAIEAKWQKFWEDNQVYKADPNHPGEPYCIVMPPPNLTGSLHMGHAFDNSLIDTMVRYHRMCGRNVLYLPGTDHASIAVHTILEKQLAEEGKTRYEIGRENFLERVQKWRVDYGGVIVKQLTCLGVSVDWSRERFTLDDILSKAVLEAFNRLYNEGLIYRGKYLVNWCPASQSAVSDVELELKEVDGSLWYLRYFLADGSGHVEIATTRPETIFGDTGVAVNPSDKRYKHLIGKTLILPIMNREIPIIGDESVDPMFGTGCVKITPAHDHNDFEIGKRNNLPFINIMNKDGSLNENTGKFQGQERFVARENIVTYLKADGVLLKVENYKHSVPYSDRGKVIIEPLLSTQWFVKVAPMADQCLELLDRTNSPEFIPERWTKVYRDWLVRLKDWCISRQLWWGHQIPAWYAVSETGGEIADHTPFVVAYSSAEAREKLVGKFGENVRIERDPDVLDTWFSSGLWPFSTLGWPETTADLKTYYPNSILVTGFDIIFFWVARMTMMAGHFTKRMPFQHVYIHGLVLDENGKKMSKSSNNGIDPLLLINKYGTDALRYTLIKEVTGAGQDIRLEYDRSKNESSSVEASRNFANKLWNAARFVMINLDGQTPQQLGMPETTELADEWILSQLHQVIQTNHDCMDRYSLGETAKAIYEFIWGDFCDWYIELVKPRLQNKFDTESRRTAQQTLAYVLEETLKLLSPLMPHITEEIWHTLTQQGKDSELILSCQSYPKVNPKLINPELKVQFNLLIGVIRTIRNLRAEADIKPGIKVNTNLLSENHQEIQILNIGKTYIKNLAKVDNLAIISVQESTSRQIKWRKILAVLFALFLVKLALAASNTLGNIPIIGNLFEIVGFLYTIWFVSHNLILSESRKKWVQKASQLITVDQQECTSAELDQSIAGVVGTIQVLIPLEGVVDTTAFRGKLEKKLTKV
ncbi:MAG TPA: valine--tRNA ligase, partial [Richelia sp.]|nr:valine--tRNA ligase [Richelia sp.]